LKIGYYLPVFLAPEGLYRGFVIDPALKKVPPAGAFLRGPPWICFAYRQYRQKIDKT